MLPMLLELTSCYIQFGDINFLTSAACKIVFAFRFYCIKYLSFIYRLKRHLKIHINSEAFVCNTCQKGKTSRVRYQYLEIYSKNYTCLLKVPTTFCRF